MIQLIEDDCRAALRRLVDEGVRVHSAVMDPPYLLESVRKRFGKEGAAPAQYGSDGRFARQSKGFMGKMWDGADPDGTRIPQDPEFWKLVYDILLPGGYVLAFSSPRTGHWQACAMEQAGFIMHPFLGWAYGQGFPKAHSVSKAIDKAAGAERRVISEGRTVRRLRPGADQMGDGSWEKLDDRTHTFQVTAAGSPEAAEWEGWFYGTQSLKPALEPIYMAQKPFDQKNGFLNVQKHRVGAVNIDACRVEVSDVDAHDLSRQINRNERDKPDGWGMNCSAGESEVAVLDAAGRWPANLLHDGSAEVLEAFPLSRGQQSDLSGAEPSSKTSTVWKSFHDRRATAARGDAGSAARFFSAFEADPRSIFYHPKATTADRVFRCMGCGERFVGRPTCGCTGDDGKAAKTEGHPTVKPVALMRWLCRLVTPPGGVVLDPFAGTGTTGQAAREEGFESVLIEREPDYIADIRCRLGLGRSSLPADVLALLGMPSDVEDLI